MKRVAAAALICVLLTTAMVNLVSINTSGAAQADAIDVITDRTDYILGQTVIANVSIDFSKGNIKQLDDVLFEWYYPNGTMIFNEYQELKELVSAEVACAESSWVSDWEGTNFRVRTIINVTAGGPSTIEDSAYFNVLSAEENVLIFSLTVVLTESSYKNNTQVTARATISFIGNGSLLQSINFSWYSPSGQKITTSSAVPNSVTGIAYSSWHANRHGENFVVNATYSGDDSIYDTATFTVDPDSTIIDGDGNGDGGVTSFLSNPVFLGILLAVIIVILLAVLLVSARRRRREVEEEAVGTESVEEPGEEPEAALKEGLEGEPGVEPVGTPHVEPTPVGASGAEVAASHSASASPAAIPIPTAIPAPAKRPELEPGNSYLIEEETSEGALELFSEYVSKGDKGLVITRAYPDKLRSTHELDVPMIWLSREQNKESINPTNLGGIFNQTELFLNKHAGEGTIVLLEGLEYLIVQNNFSSVLKFLHQLNDAVTINDAKLLISFNLKTLESSERAMLTKDLKIIKVG